MLGIDKPGRYELSVEAKIGVIPAAITLKTDGGITIEFQAPKSDLISSKFTHQQIGDALGIPLEIIDQKVPLLSRKTIKISTSPFLP
jgi:hypothetical protein